MTKPKGPNRTRTGPDSTRFTVLLSEMAEGMILLDAADRVRFVNKAALGLLGQQSADWLGLSVSELDPGLHRVLTAAIDAFRSRRSSAMTATLSIQGRILAAHLSSLEGKGVRHLLPVGPKGACAQEVPDPFSFYAGLIVFFQDLTDEAEFRSHLVHAEKMVVMGELAAAVAHEINNPLGGILEAIRIIQDRPCDPERIGKFLPLVSEGLEQIRRSVQRMLSFSQKHVAEKRVVQIEDVVSQSVEFLGHRARHEEVDLRLDLRSGNTCVHGDPHALCQVFVNLINNALDSLKERPERRVEVTSERPAPGEVAVQVSDTGCGIPPELSSRVFDPFFTTKPTGKGTGLGLSISANIIREHGGTITLAPRAGGGAVFTVKLPIIPTPAAARNPRDRRSP